LDFAEQVLVTKQIRVHSAAIEIKIDFDLQKSFNGSRHQTIASIGPLKLGQREDSFDEGI